SGALAIHAYDDPRTLSGQGTLAMEFEEQVRGLESVLIAVGGGGLIGGAAAWYQDRVRVIGVEPQRAPTLFKALEAGEIVDVETGGIAADSLGARRAGELMFPIAQRFVQRVVLSRTSKLSRLNACFGGSCASSPNRAVPPHWLRYYPAPIRCIPESASAWLFAAPMPSFQASRFSSRVELQPGIRNEY